MTMMYIDGEQYSRRVCSFSSPTGNTLHLRLVFADCKREDGGRINIYIHIYVDVYVWYRVERVGTIKTDGTNGKSNARRGLKNILDFPMKRLFHIPRRDSLPSLMLRMERQRER